MAQLRHDYSQFVARDIEVVVVGPEDARAFAEYWQSDAERTAISHTSQVVVNQTA
jgi:hypothetical protein